MPKELKPKVEPTEPAVVEAPVQVESYTEVHLDRDPNDPRNQPVIDGASVPPIDINVPLEV